MNKTIYVKDETLWRAFVAKCRADGVSHSSRIESLVAKFMQEAPIVTQHD